METISQPPETIGVLGIAVIDTGQYRMKTKKTAAILISQPFFPVASENAS
jgi:hypothetical protein